MGDIMSQIEEINGMKVLTAKIDNLDMNALRNFGDNLKQKIGSGIIVLATSNEDKVNLLAMVSDDLVKRGAHAGNIIKEIAKIVGGGGGGRPNMAQAGGKDSTKIDEALEKAKEVIKAVK